MSLTHTNTYLACLEVRTRNALNLRLLFFLCFVRAPPRLAREGEMQPYKGTKYQTVDDRYADGWAYNANTRRWIKVACQQKKDAIDALPALLVSTIQSTSVQFSPFQSREVTG